jgi:hypothetical protein
MDWACAPHSTGACRGACLRDDPMEPVLSEPGFVVRVSIPGLTDTTFQGDSLYWRFISGPDPVLGRRRQLNLKLLVLDPPSPLESPLVLDAQWNHVATPLPDQRSYDLSFENVEGVFLQANSNLGTWGASSGRITLSEVTDSSLRGDMIVTDLCGELRIGPRVRPRG